jgi:signal transduction histidine kinase/ActR/RegA family two-component response regulator
LKKIVLVVIAFCIHFSLVKFGALFTIPFGFASLIWPVSGVMLGLYLLYGRTILIGSLLSSLLTIYQQNITHSLPTYLIGILATVSVLQFVISKHLVLRYLALPLKTHIPSEIIKFLLLTGPLSAFITSSILAITLWISLDIHDEVLYYIWASKWIGDFISIIFLTPVILFIGENIYVKKAKHSTAAILTSLVVLSVISFIFILSSHNKHMEKEQQFINTTQLFVAHINVIQTSIKHHLTALDGLFQSNENVTRSGFKSFTNTIDKLNINVRALAWVPLITDKNRKSFELALLEDGFTPHYIKKLTDQGFQPSPKQSYYLPITFVEPLVENKSAVGLDVSTHPSVRESVNKAINLKVHVVTPLLSLVQQQNKFTGVVVYYPIYKKNTQTLTMSLKGLVEAVFELDLLLADVYKKISASHFTYQLSYGKGNVFTHPAYEKDRLFNHNVEVDIFDKKGQLSFSSTEKFEQGIIDWTSLIIMLVVCTIGIICVMFVFFIVTFNYSLRKKVKEKTAKLIKSNDELVKANTAKNLFLANISHEYRTPLNAIIGFTEIAQCETKDETAIDYLSKINHSSNILLDIVNDVLDLSKIQAGELNLESNAFNPAIETSLVIEMLKVKATEKSISINNEFSNNFDLWVAGDEFRFKQILINLLNNAVKFTLQGVITVSGDCQNTEDNTRILTLSVKDTGIGIIEDQQQHIFNAFVQAESAITRKYGGTGLGLSIVKQLCTLMGGDIKLTSEEGKGSIFTVTLELPQAIQPIEKNKKTKSELQKSNYEGVNVLVVEDNKINQIIAQKQLTSLGARCDLADDGQQALIYLEQHKPMLILMDLQMPNMDGFTASRLIKQNSKLKDIPIIILSASVGKEDKEKARELGIEDFIHKPFQKADLQYVLHKYCKNNGETIVL